jgi:hypothetical protein
MKAHRLAAGAQPLADEEDAGRNTIPQLRTVGDRS